MTSTEFHQMINMLLFKKYDALPDAFLPRNEELVSDWKHRKLIESYIVEISDQYSNYVPRFHWIVSPFNSDKVIPAIPKHETARMYDARKTS